ncbi:MULTISPECIES: TraV family lipoprotein [Halomonas]|uniref:TraV family lipoprotein n=1 Tax=Halomonas TaxID=2745 RepID=UPI001D0106CA|nr:MULTISPECIES: TraV family lipoprotein [Halomonas]
MTSTFKMITVAGMLAILSGCTALSGGSGNYSCEGMGGDAEEGCMSVRDTYEDTHVLDDTNAVEPTQVALENARHVAESYVSPQLPNRPVPVRTPAEVMRIWVAPWESDRGDLMTNGYVYTEIEPRRWTLGDQPGGQNTRTLDPLSPQ